VALDSRFLAFIVVFALLIITPGPDTALTIRNTLRGGWRAAWFTAFGVGLGTLFWVGCAVYGVVLILERSPTAFMALKLGGAAYLAYLGARSLMAARTVRPANVENPDESRDRSSSDWAPFRQGLFSNLLNAKTGLFFITLLPQFVTVADPPSRAIAMVIAYEAMVISWLGAYGYVVSRAARTVASPRFRRALEAATGLVLVVLAIGVII